MATKKTRVRRPVARKKQAKPSPKGDNIILNVKALTELTRRIDELQQMYNTLMQPKEIKPEPGVMAIASH